MISVINLLFSLGSAISSFLLILSLISFSVEPLSWVYSVLADADAENMDDKAFFLKHCLRLVAVIVIFIVLRITPTAETLIVLLRKGLSLW